MRLARGLRHLGHALVVAALLAPGAASASEAKHGLSAFGDLAYPADFDHFGYADPAAKKGGRLSLVGFSGVTTFNSLNNFILKGDTAEGLELLFDSLMARAADEPDAVYGLVASSAEVADDKMSVTFKLRPEAKFSDGSPVTPEDVKYSFEILKTQGHPMFGQMLQDVVGAEVIDPQTIRYTFKGALTRDLPLTVAQLPVLSKTFYATRAFAETTLEPPVGSGPYTVGEVRQGATIVYKRNPDYWAKDLPVNRGRWNFDEIRFEYFRDRTASMQAFKAGAYDFREEYTSKVWATEYGFPAAAQGRVKVETLPDETPSGTQGFFLNIRRGQFIDPKVRTALDLAFDFEWTNKNIFFGLYRRTQSYFENSTLKAKGLPSDAERALFDELGAPVPPEALGEAVLPSVTDGSGQDRAKLRQASAMLDEAGWKLRTAEVADPNCSTLCKAMIAVGIGSAATERVRTNDKGERLAVEMLMYEPEFERVFAPYVKNLKLIGVDAFVRMVDPSQYQQRLKGFDFDLTTQRYVMRDTPGVELRNYFGSASAKMSGSLNLSGISDPAVDALVDRIIAAKDRDHLTTAAHALDRVLRAGHYWVPHWYKAAHNIAYWDKFSRPAVTPRYDRGLLDTWWYDPDKAAKLAANR